MVGLKLSITVLGAFMHLSTRTSANSPIQTGTYHCILFLQFGVFFLKYAVLDFAVQRA